MNYRLLNDDEYEKLRPIFGDLVPHAGLSYVGILEDDGDILATESVHLQLHLDHFWISPNAKMIVDWRKLWNIIDRRIPKCPGLRIYAAPTFENGERMLGILGFRKTPFPVGVKEY